MNNYQFVDILKQSFVAYLQTSARSNKKLKILHKAIAEDLAARLRAQGGSDFAVCAYGVGDGRERKIAGRYMEKAVDITITMTNGKPVAGIAVKYIMSNYRQNSNNYFEQMLGETANIRSAKIPYFQIIAIPDSIPYYDREGRIVNTECISERNLHKYVKLSEDDTDVYMHTPNKTLVYIVNLSSPDGTSPTTREDYRAQYLNHPFELRPSTQTHNFRSTVIYNDYEAFAAKVVYTILSM